jgi:hypothetical protein
MRRPGLLVAIGMLAGVTGWYGLFAESDRTNERAVPETPKTQSGSVRPAGATPGVSIPPDWPPPFPEAPAERERVPLPPLEPPVPAAHSMADARESGDPRTPPIRRAPDMSETPALEELADPAAYQRYEARQNMRTFAAFVQAANAEIPKLRHDIARARVAGMPPEQISRAEEKLRRLESMRSELLQKHPELGR